MLGNFKIKRWLFGLPLLAGALLITAPLASAQTTDEREVAKATTASSKVDSAMRPEPVFTNYRGIRLGMTADEVRGKLDHLREKGKIQDFFVLSDEEAAQVFYDSNGKVQAISIDYIGKNSNPPTPREVLGEDLQAKPDGSMYDLKRYPSAGYWVAYNRTAGNDATVTVTIQSSSP